mmetsp:Transcript_33818/g.32927  ORF Transcript_33818/g.32927 Transcript_33818/m.32927 type:complete len:124 (+) Transcript_33818:240-611(+)
MCLVTSFSYYHWRLMNLIVKKLVFIEELSIEELQQLCYTQLPDGSTLLHLIRKNESFVEELFERMNNPESQEKYYVPILQDMYEKTALDYLFMEEVQKKRVLKKKENQNFMQEEMEEEAYNRK